MQKQVGDGSTQTLKPSDPSRDWCQEVVNEGVEEQGQNYWPTKPHTPRRLVSLSPLPFCRSHLETFGLEYFEVNIFWVLVWIMKWENMNLVCIFDIYILWWSVLIYAFVVIWWLTDRFLGKRCVTLWLEPIGGPHIQQEKGFVQVGREENNFLTA